ncbi:MAG: hypothetical protein ACD_19C00176G0088 [uncultured bacterium]|nr:MAG: hypothetical protein ACD_19C00176G0088 [uncultured bacterium]
MLETPHVALGMAIAVAVPNPLISIPLAFASHFLLDTVPHWNPHINTEMKKYGKLTNRTLRIIGIDIVLAIILTIFVAKTNPYVYLASFMSILPDVAEGPYFLWGWRNKHLDAILRFQRSIQSNANVFWGLFTQILVVLGALYIIS